MRKRSRRTSAAYLGIETEREVVLEGPGEEIAAEAVAELREQRAQLHGGVRQGLAEGRVRQRRGHVVTQERVERGPGPHVHLHGRLTLWVDFARFEKSSQYIYSPSYTLGRR